MTKPLGGRSYGSIPHLIGSRMGPGDHHAEPGQCRIATERKRDKYDIIIVQEKLDGGNVGVAKIGRQIIALTRAGYLATSSSYRTHHAFELYVRQNEHRFDMLLNDGERICGEWLLTAVGTKYNLPHEPFVPFDIMQDTSRLCFTDFIRRIDGFDFIIPRCLSIGEPLDIESTLIMLEHSGHGAIDPVEGAVWRVERKGIVDFLVKYVRPNKKDGKHLETDTFNGVPDEYKHLTWKL